MDFTNPTRIEPFFDVEAETNVRVPGQTYRVTVGFAGTPRSAAADAQLRSAAADGRRAGAAVQRRAPRTARSAPELRALQNPNQAQTDILTARATQALDGAALRGGRQGRRADLRRRHVPADAVVRRSVPASSSDGAPQSDGAADDRQAHLRPRLPDVLAQPQHDRSTTRSSCSRYDESDRVSWILSRNEDSQTYALEFRVRHIF